jgi:hypothetical protein
MTRSQQEHTGRAIVSLLPTNDDYLHLLSMSQVQQA